MKKIVAIAVAVVAGALISCSGKSDKLVPAGPGGNNEKVTSQFDDPKIDILFVVDDSGSMDVHQQDLSSNIDLFVNQIKNMNLIDYHIGVTTTSVDMVASSVSPYGELYASPGSPKYITPKTLNGDAYLRANLLVGTSGSGQEELFNPVYLALTNPMLSGPNAGFYRKDANLAVIFITDAEDQSDQTTPNLDAAGLKAFLQGLKKGTTAKILGYGAIVPSGVNNCPRDQYDEPKRIEQFLNSLNGQFFSLCDPSFGTQLAGVAKNLVRNITRVLHLTTIPVVSTIRVTYGNQVIPNDYQLGWVFEPSTNSIIFADKFVFPNIPNATLSITYKSVGE